MPMEFIVPILGIVAVTWLAYSIIFENRLEELLRLVEDHFIVGFEWGV